tara:strand:- start:3262 stop:4398 length:1137 start_codon:yes stop_codon:yes gene_type:complete
MIFAIDFVGTNIGSGTKSYSLNFCNELHNFKTRDKIVIFVTEDYFKQLDFDEKNNSHIRYIKKPNYFSNIFFRLIWMQFILPFELKYMNINKLFSPMNICPIFAKIFKIKIVLALHSNLPWKFFNLMPGNYFRNFLTKKLMEISIQACETLIVDSYFAKDEISNILKIKKKIVVIYLGIDKKFLLPNSPKSFEENFNYSEKYIISVLSCVKYHNILNLLKAFKLLIDEKLINIKLVLVLQILDKNYAKEIFEFISLNFKNNEIKIYTNLNSKKLTNLYKYSELYLFSSYCEVFGLTSLEAMSQGCPVLISKASALPEINGEAAEYFDPDDVEDIKNKLNKMLTDNDYKKILVDKGHIHHKKFTWSLNVKKTLNVIDDF